MLARITGVAVKGPVLYPPPVRANYTPHVWPKTVAPVVIDAPTGPEIAHLRWGVPVQIQGATKPLTKFVTNARDDSLHKFPWRNLLPGRRCLIPAAAYFEPDGPPGGKWEVRFSLRDRSAFFFAGMWDLDHDFKPSTFTMVTTGPNELAAKIHDRMPVVLDDAGARAWLGQFPIPMERAREICRPYSSTAMESVALPPPEKKIRKQDLATGTGEFEF